MVRLQAIALAATTLLFQGNAAPAVAANNLVQTGSDHGNVLPGQYIITLKSGLRARHLDEHIDWVKGVHKRSMSASLKTALFRGVERTFAGVHDFQGYAGHFDNATIAEIRDHADVDSVEEDRIWQLALILDDKNSTMGDRNLSDGNSTIEWYSDSLSKRSLFQKRAISTQKPAPWGLAAISHRAPGATTYSYDSDSGDKMFAYVVDTGVRVTHRDFEGRATAGYNAIGGQNVDTHGHGTHVAATIGGKVFGVAKKAQIVSIKVFQNGGSATSVIMDGVSWAVNDIKSKNRQDKAVINMSLGGGFSSAFNKLVDSASDAGVLSIVAAGNERRDARVISPASAASAITVGAVDINWQLADFSNYGALLDIFGPGVNIPSAWFQSDTDQRSISGTSMATPHIAGLALNAMSVNNVHGVKAVTEYLVSTTVTKNKLVGSLKGSVNLMGNNNVAGQ